MIKITKSQIGLLVLAVLGANTAFSKAILDESKRVLLISQAYDENGNSKLTSETGARLDARLTIGEFRWSENTGFDMQGLFTTENAGLVYPGNSPNVRTIPFAPAIPNPGNLTKADLEDNYLAWANQNAYTFAHKNQGPNNARMLPEWLAANSLPYAILSFSQDFTVSSDLGPGKAKVAFDKIVMPRLTPNAPDKTTYGKPTLNADNLSYLKILYYPKGVDSGVGQSGANQYSDKGGKLTYIVYDIKNGSELKRETIDVQGAFDSPSYGNDRTPDSVMNCMYDSRKSGCKPTPVDIRQLMSRFLASHTFVEYYKTPELKTTTNDQGDASVDGKLSVTKRELEYKGCAVRFINEGTYSYTTVQTGERWLFFWGGKKQLLNRGSYTSDRTDNYRKELTYYTDASFAANAPALPYNRARAEKTIQLKDEFITPEHNNNNELIRASEYQGTLDPLPPIQIKGSDSQIRYRNTNGSALVEATCSPEGDVLFFFGKSKGTAAKLQYEAWDFKSPATSKTASFKDSGVCAEGQAQINGDLIYFTSPAWSNKDSSIGDAKGAGCGTTFVNGLAITGGFSGQNYCPPGFSEDSCDKTLCSYKGSCRATTGGTTNLANGTCDAPKNEYRVVSIDPSSKVNNGPAGVVSPAPKFGGTARCAPSPVGGASPSNPGDTPNGGPLGGGLLGGGPLGRGLLSN